MENTQENYNLISAEVVADSLNQFGERITTMKLVFPRIILAEFNTHRMFNRNSASSRALPFKKMVKMVQEQPFITIAWQKEHTGMQGYEYITDEKNLRRIKEDWLEARDNAIYSATQLNNGFNLKDEEGKYVMTKPELRVDRVTKQLCNRLLEPFMYHTVLVTATEWENFFELRCPKYQTPVSQTIEPQRSWKDLTNNHSNEVNITLLNENKDNIIFKLQHNKGAAEIHIMDLAEKMWDAYNESTPKQLEAGQWHIPFREFNTPQKENNYIDWEAKYIYNKITKEKNRLPFVEELVQESIKTRVKIATARCARISYETLGDSPEIDYEKDIKLHDDLLAMKHFSPFEHCAKAMTEEEYIGYRRGDSEYGHSIYPIQNKKYGWSRNLKGFKQYREIIE